MRKTALALTLFATLLLLGCGGYLPSPPTATPQVPTPTSVLGRVPAALRTPTPVPTSGPAGYYIHQAGTPVVTTVVWAQGEREAYFEFARETAGAGMEELGQPIPTGSEYLEACGLLQKHDFEAAGVALDPGATTRVGMLAGGLDGMFNVFARMEWDGRTRMDLYTLPHFCSDAMQP